MTDVPKILSARGVTKDDFVDRWNREILPALRQMQRTVLALINQSFYSTIDDEGIELPQRSTIDFQGTGVTATDNGSKTVVTIPGIPPGSGLSVAGAGLYEAPAGTVNVGANVDASIIVNADDIQVAAAIQSGAALGATAVQPARTLTAGAGLTGGGDLSANRTFDVGANADGSIAVGANDVGVGVLATDAQHGARGGGTQHLPVSNTAAGFAVAITGPNLVLQSNGAGTAATWVVPGLTMTTVEINLGTKAIQSGRFTIAGAGLTAGKPVLIQKANGPYTGKGNLADEAEMDQLDVSAAVLDATTIEAFWQSVGPVMGNFKFNYTVSS